MTATPTPEAPAAPITENSAHAGPDRPPRDGPDRFEGRKLVIASAHGTQDADEWVARAQDLGVTVMRLTDVVQTSLEDCLSDPDDRYEEMDSRARAAVDAGMGVVLDLSFIRDAAVRAGRNPYRTDFDWAPYVTSLLTRPFPTGDTYGTSEHVVYISLPSEPRVDWGEDPNERAESAEDLIAFYQRLARLVRRATVDRPLAAAGFVHHTADGNGTDAGLDITAVYSLVEVDVCTTHAYDQDSLNALPMLTRYAHALGKPLILEETGRDAQERPDDEMADWIARLQKACAAAGVDGVGVWDAEQSRGFDVRPPQYPLTAAAVRRMVDAVIPEGIDVQKDPVTHGEHAATPDEAASRDVPSAGSAGDNDGETAEGDDRDALAGLGAAEDETAGAGRADGGVPDDDASATASADGAADGGPQVAGGERAAGADEPADAADAGSEAGAEPGADGAGRDEGAPGAEGPADLQALRALIDVGSVPAPDAAESVLDRGEDAIWQSMMAPDPVPGGDPDPGEGDDAADEDGAGDAAEDVSAGAADGGSDRDGGDVPHVALTGVDELDDEEDAPDDEAVPPRRAWEDLPPLS
ncbi:hypothetical protein [Actinomyces israelii]|uniref:hypothetical protein n=1 Tax=Actinomyces israelii TaxID=1659 RepID=UPI002552F88F|nr:hypothetical protein [Actinomyces israelii]WKR21538.1 hypothetical protein AIF0345_1454 [Actinomyces israelii]